MRIYGTYLRIKTDKQIIRISAKSNHLKPIHVSVTYKVMLFFARHWGVEQEHQTVLNLAKDGSDVTGWAPNHSGRFGEETNS
jgi:hypothetical protein